MADDMPDTRLHLDMWVSYEEMVAALYFGAGLTPDDLSTDADVLKTVQIRTGIVGMMNLSAYAGDLAATEARGDIDRPEWLAYCRQRVKEVFGRGGVIGQVA